MFKFYHYPLLTHSKSGTTNLHSVENRSVSRTIMSIIKGFGGRYISISYKRIVSYSNGVNCSDSNDILKDL